MDGSRTSGPPGRGLPERKEGGYGRSRGVAAPDRWGDAFGYVFCSRNWFGGPAVGALCPAFFRAFLIPLVILLGCFVETARVVGRGGREFAAWTDIGQKVSDGFVLAVVLFIWELCGSILSGAAGDAGSGALVGLSSLLPGWVDRVV